MTGKAQIHIGGTPTAPDVQKLIDHFGQPTEGTEITWEEIAGVIHEPITSNRYKTVTNAWRRRLMRDHNIHLVAIGNGLGLVAADPIKRISDSARKFNGGMRRIKRAAVVAGTTDRQRLDDEQRRIGDHLVNASSTFTGWLRTSAKQIEYPTGESDGEEG